MNMNIIDAIIILIILLGGIGIYILKNENINLENEANETHYKVGKEIRNTIRKLGGTMPENLPTPKKSLKELEKNKKLETKILE